MRRKEVVKDNGKEYVIVYEPTQLICYDDRGRVKFKYVELACQPHQPTERKGNETSSRQ